MLSNTGGPDVAPDPVTARMHARPRGQGLFGAPGAPRCLVEHDWGAPRRRGLVEPERARPRVVLSYQSGGRCDP